ncbi:MAG: protein-L-isoaspartate(D-aspartate) O-methyltransferase [Bacteroidales bacterium]
MTIHFYQGGGMHHPIKKILFLTIICTILLASFNAFADGMQRERTRMVRDQVQARGINHDATLEAMRTVPRHLYVPASQRRFAYDDRPLAIGHGQTISQPFIVGFMTALIDPNNDFKVLEIGTGSGYQAAVLGEIADQVYTIEIIRELGVQARRRLESQYDNVHVKIADGYYGWEEHAPFDAIVVTAAAEYIPPPLIDQLKEGGKMVIPVGSPFQTQQLMLVKKEDDGELTTQSLMPVRFVPFEREEE